MMSTQRTVPCVSRHAVLEWLKKSETHWKCRLFQPVSGVSIHKTPPFDAFLMLFCILYRLRQPNLHFAFFNKLKILIGLKDAAHVTTQTIRYIINHTFWVATRKAVPMSRPYVSGVSKKSVASRPQKTETGTSMVITRSVFLFEGDIDPKTAANKMFTTIILKLYTSKYSSKTEAIGITMKGNKYNNDFFIYSSISMYQNNFYWNVFYLNQTFFYITAPPFLTLISKLIITCNTKKHKRFMIICHDETILLYWGCLHFNIP